ncbi:hypothetical protein [Neisseria weaveri]|nr:hypothetical protein [Neisseria weaveri]
MDKEILEKLKLRFGVSEGMILSAATADGKLKLLDVDAGAQPGNKVG